MTRRSLTWVGTIEKEKRIKEERGKKETNGEKKKKLGRRK